LLNGQRITKSGEYKSHSSFRIRALEHYCEDTVTKSENIAIDSKDQKIVHQRIIKILIRYHQSRADRLYQLSITEKILGLSKGQFIDA